MPSLTVKWKLKSQKPATQEVGGARGQRWVNVGVAEECVVVVEITRNSRAKVKCVLCVRVCVKYTIAPLQHQGRNTRAHAPKFPKMKDEGWWALIGEVDSGELLALKRVGYVRSRTVTTLAISAPEGPCRKIITLYLISDCYLGLDQQHDMRLNFVAAGNE